MHNVHPEVFRLYNNVNTRSLDRRTIHELFFWRKRLPKEHKAILEKIINQFNDIHEALKPVIKFGISFDIWLVGGSVRDLILGNGHLIKDLDIMLSFYQSYTPIVPKATTFIKKSKLDFSKPELQPIIYRDGSTTPFAHWDLLQTKTKDWKVKAQKKQVRKTALFDMITCSLAQKLDVYEIYKPSITATNDEQITEKYVDNRINGVIKLKKDDWAWPVDVLITDNSIDTFLDAFDFGICKVGMELIRGSDIREQRKVARQTPANLMKRARITRHFLTDYQKKQLSMSVSEPMTLRQIQHSCENHLERLEKKYPWKVKINMESSMFDSDPQLQNIKKDIREEYLEAFFLKRKLEKKLDTKTVGKKSVKKI